jgi:hypothetical protein
MLLFFLFQCLAFSIFGLNITYSAESEFGGSYINGNYQQNLFREVPYDYQAFSSEQSLKNHDLNYAPKRYVKVNFDYLNEADSVVLNLFKDISFTATKDKVSKRSGYRYSWFGHIAGMAQNSVILVIDNGVMVGNIIKNGKFYQIRPYDGDIHMIREINQSDFPPEAPPIPVGDKGPLSFEAPPAQFDESTYIDVMVVYTDDVARASPNIHSEIQLAIDETNTSFANSDIQTRVRLVHSVEVNYSETADIGTDLECITRKTDGCLDNVHALRDSRGADLVSFWVEDGGLYYCGVAWIMQSVTSSFESNAFSVVVRDCATGIYAFGHELGHNMGAQHDRYVANISGAYEYSYGYVYTPDRWVTIMAYQSECFVSGVYCSRIPYWSNPAITINGIPTGIREGLPNSADNSKTINNTAFTVANFRSSATFSDPVPEIRIDGLTDFLTIRKGSSLMIAVELDAGSDSGKEADWWVLAKTPIGEWYYFDYPLSVWRYAGSLDNVSTSYQGTLRDLAPLELYDLDTSNLSEGKYIFYFAVDTIMNGSIDYNEIQYDSVIVNLTP